MKYVCEICGTVYDEMKGDQKKGIPAGTLFSALPAYFACPVCGAEKEAFTREGDGTAQISTDHYHSQR